MSKYVAAFKAGQALLLKVEAVQEEEGDVMVKSIQHFLGPFHTTPGSYFRVRKHSAEDGWHLFDTMVAALDWLTDQSITYEQSLEAKARQAAQQTFRLCDLYQKHKNDDTEIEYDPV
jgi:hypothetical protein